MLFEHKNNNETFISIYLSAIIVAVIGTLFSFAAFSILQKQIQKKKIG
jgi:phosphate/sulfate permease